MVRTKRSSSSLKNVIEETRRKSKVIKTSRERSTTYAPKADSSGKKHKSRDDSVVNKILSDIECDVSSYVENLVESAKDSDEEEQVVDRNVNKKIAVVPKKNNRELKVLKEIRKYQNSTDLLIPRAVFARVCKELFQQFGHDLRIARIALECLQEAAEAFLVQLLEDAYLCTLHAQRKTLMNKDLRLARRIAGIGGSYA